MAGAGGRSHPAVGAPAALGEQLLGGEEYRFGFFQASRLIDLLRARSAQERIGRAALPDDEPVRFQSRVSLGFPASEIYALGFDPEDPRQFDRRQRVPRLLDWRAPRRPLHMTVNFMGLVGSQAVLPIHYTEQVLARLRKGDRALRDFLDLLSHRFIAFFFRAWSKHRPGIDLEWRSQRHRRAEELASDEPLVRYDQHSRHLFSLFGMGTGRLHGRMAVPDEALLRYTHLLYLCRRPAWALAELVRDFLELPEALVHIEQFVVQRLQLPEAEQSQLGERNHGLGETAVCGDEVTVADAKFEIRLGPLLHERFFELLPPGSGSSGLPFRRLAQLARLLVGPELDFDIRLTLDKRAVAPARIDDSAEEPARLGVSLWLINQTPELDLADSVFPSALGE
jgi:type VI secretion system protein ImpH